ETPAYGRGLFFCVTPKTAADGPKHTQKPYKTRAGPVTVTMVLLQPRLFELSSACFPLAMVMLSRATVKSLAQESNAQWNAVSYALICVMIAYQNALGTDCYRMDCIRLR